MTRAAAQPGPIAQPSEVRAALTKDEANIPGELASNLLQANPGQSAAAPRV